MPFGDDRCRESEGEGVDCIDCFREIPTYGASGGARIAGYPYVDSCLLQRNFETDSDLVLSKIGISSIVRKVGPCVSLGLASSPLSSVGHQASRPGSTLTLHRPCILTLTPGLH